MPPDLLLITWNRLQYVEKTISNLLSDQSDFNLYVWDNNSTDGTADLISSVNDPRVKKKVFSGENVKQRKPSLWFLENSTSNVVGKVDDDILLPHGWTDKIYPVVVNNATAGMIGCWIFMEEDWNPNKAQHKIVQLGDMQIFQNIMIAGQSFLAKKELLKNYILPESYGYGFPVDQAKMTIDGYKNGYIFPILFAHNMDDPRSTHYLYKDGSIHKNSALTARARGFTSSEEYASWIRQDAKNILTEPLSYQIRRNNIARDNTIIGKIRRKLHKITQA